MQASGEKSLPLEIVSFVSDLHARAVKGEVGFRRRNMPALLFRFFGDMRRVLENIYRALKPGCDAMIVMGDNITTIGSETIRIPTTSFVASVARHVGLELVETIPITVTTENLVHIKNAIKENSVIRLRRPA
jgi:hypothetical protein